VIFELFKDIEQSFRRLQDQGTEALRRRVDGMIKGAPTSLLQAIHAAEGPLIELAHYCMLRVADEIRKRDGTS
jgi:hypothetical protein